MTSRVLIVDDESNIRRMLRALLEQDSHEVDDHDDAAAALRAVDDFEPDVVLLDLIMPNGPNGMELLETIKNQFPHVIVIMMSGQATLTDAVRATRLGAFQFLEKPLSPEAVLVTVQSALALRRAERENQALRLTQAAEDEIVGVSAAIVELRKRIEQVAPTPTRVLITGESGTGKELVARAIHHRSPRRNRTMVSVNCAAIPRELIESEMFGHERGAFTGASARRHGRFELAHHGTLFLDEIGDLRLEAQAKLLRALETNTIERVGSERQIPVDVRVIAATNQNLERACREGRFREDLFYRLNVVPVAVPPLRERPQDIPLLTEHFARLAAAKCGLPAPTFADDALAALRAYTWPGNIRELANTIERCTILSSPGPIDRHTVQDLLKPGRTAARGPSFDPGQGLVDALATYERNLIQAALDSSDGNVADAARMLKTDRPNLYRRMKRLRVDPRQGSVS
jgi:DNA-binding NtrC family response regulator